MEIKKLIGLVCAHVTYTCMNNHFYSIGGDIGVQEDGRSIGSDFIGKVARVYMLLWDDKLLKRCKDLDVSLDCYSRYVDDQVIVMRAIGRGWMYNRNTNRMVFDERLENSCTLSDTERTAKVISEIANSLNPSI